MKPAKLLLATVACLVTWSVGAAEAAFMAVDAVLDHTDLSDTNPINWSLQFQPVLTEIHSVTLDAYWIGDGLGSGEGVTFWGVEGAHHLFPYPYLSRILSGGLRSFP